METLVGIDAQGNEVWVHDPEAQQWIDTLETPRRVLGTWLRLPCEHWALFERNGPFCTADVEAAAEDCPYC